MRNMPANAKRAPSPQGRGGRPSVGKEKVRAGASSPVALRKGFGSNSPIRTRPGSLSDAEEEAGGTPAELTKERVHVWVRVLPSSTAGDSPPEQSVVVVDAEARRVSVLGAGGEMEASVVADGVVSPSQHLASAHESMLGDLVSFTASDPSGRHCSALLCHGGGTEGGGRSPALLGSDALAQQSAVRLLSAVAGNGATLYLAAVLISMEILVDLLEPPSDVSIAETQFSGVHLAGVAWHELKASNEVGGLLDRVGGSLEAVGRQMSAGMCSRHTCVLVLRVAPADGSAYGNVLYLVDLAEPSLLRESQVGGLSVDDYCSVNTTLKVLSKCLGAMGSRRKQPPPLRDSKLTHLLAPALGDDTGKVHALVYVEQPRRQRREAAAAVAWAAKAGSARLKKGTYASSNSKALVAQLQGVLAQLDFASEEMRAEMREQISPDPVALEKLRGAQAAKVNALDGKAADKAAAQEALSVQLEANVAARHVAVAQRADVEAAVADLRDQVAGVRSGAKLEAAMNTLKTSIREEKEALASQLAEMQARREKATASLGELAARGAALAAGGPECVSALCEQGAAYHERGIAKIASLLFVSAIKVLDATGRSRSTQAVRPISALADLYSAEGMEEEAISLYKQATPLRAYP